MRGALHADEIVAPDEHRVGVHDLRAIGGESRRHLGQLVVSQLLGFTTGQQLEVDLSRSHECIRAAHKSQHVAIR